jgi:hypothetical protein
VIADSSQKEQENAEIIPTSETENGNRETGIRDCKFRSKTLFYNSKFK